MGNAGLTANSTNRHHRSSAICSGPSVRQFLARAKDRAFYDKTSPPAYVRSHADTVSSVRLDSRFNIDIYSAARRRILSDPLRDVFRANKLSGLVD